MRPLRRTERPPAHDAVNIGPWPRPGSRCQRRALFVCQDRRLSGRLACHQCLRAAGIEAQHPVPDHRQAHAAGSRGLAAGPAVGDHRKGRKPPRLIRILAPARCATQVIARKVRSRLNSRSRRKPPLFSMVNHAQHRLANPLAEPVSVSRSIIPAPGLPPTPMPLALQSISVVHPTACRPSDSVMSTRLARTGEFGAAGIVSRIVPSEPAAAPVPTGKKAAASGISSTRPASGAKRGPFSHSWITLALNAYRRATRATEIPAVPAC